MAQSASVSNRRQSRVRRRLKANSGARLRLSVFRSDKNIYAQIIDDVKGTTLVAASSLDKDLKKGLPKGGNKDAAAAVGQSIGEKAAKAGIKEVVFDRGGYLYHGRVKSLAEAAREVGLNF